MSELGFRVSGAEQADDNVVVLLHGMFGAKGNLLSIGRVLSDDFHVIALDLPGHGESSVMQEMTFPNMALAVQEFLQEKGVGKVHLIGHSLGGKVAMQYATNYPETTASVTVLDIAPVTYEGGGHDSIFQAIEELDLATVVSRNDALTHFLGYMDDADTAKFILTNLKRTETGYEWRINFKVLQENYHNLVAAPVYQSLYNGPALVLKGELSAYIQEKFTDAFAQYLPKAKHHVVKGVGHWLHAEKPQEVQQHITRFLNRQT